MNKKPAVTNRDLDRAVSRSAKLEGYSFSKAKKNKAVIKLLQKHGRAFTL
jgi:hypothetical protein